MIEGVGAVEFTVYLLVFLKKEWKRENRPPASAPASVGNMTDF
jgi:hypothetical protein